jgi:probable DNA metabolism protein
MRRNVDVLFDGTYEGFLSVVYAYYHDGINPVSVQEADQYQPSIGLDKYFVVTDYERADKVEKAIHKKISGNVAHRVSYAFLNGSADRFDAILRYLIYAFKIGRGVDDHMHHDFILRVHKLSREVGREAHKLTGFCRFAETWQGIYYCAITPQHHVLLPLAGHFSDRMMNQAWVIHDKNYNKAAVYDGNEYTFVAVSPHHETPVMAGSEQMIQDLWVTYFNTAAIQARKNPRLHRQMLPLKYRGNMVEFADN